MEAQVQVLISEGVLDAQFNELMQLQDESNFLLEVIQLYFEDSATKIESIHRMLQAPEPDFQELDQLVHQFKGSSASLGARAITELCVQLRAHCQQRNKQGCEACMAHMGHAYEVLKAKLQALMADEAARTQS
uniref:Histidine-containing phosphotransfer protein n=1 Tax=Dunaliella tertiolecta TaxID=3047 RepID=A0A7S3QPF2_DUNTE|mmetsp:Transcript_7883/g.21028  ORF Transcript_7883/g.21028 Transcript_7883/m.21028 type:complete len:133 (+) Transcript_7883:64-462(+)|eukprot:CAMPEP_0202349204 /NCGR_PEP_ID=MMETSP1126-20121109/6796_1 /ASSEMBLY_ACC=CAM_ASM_000457 /TAXON_ID=3047 /ORGANISM="Dunaliella tertiolecta, Strain CCMP1320" /LENGTH=132 /DNA_ID=CAMNT_0048940981 /DNA_START=177 /DNA_END=575 /DNA_ORIENTATION=-